MIKTSIFRKLANTAPSVFNALSQTTNEPGSPAYALGQLLGNGYDPGIMEEIMTTYPKPTSSVEANSFLDDMLFSNYFTETNGDMLKGYSPSNIHPDIDPNTGLQTLTDIADNHLGQKFNPARTSAARMLLNNPHVGTSKDPNLRKIKLFDRLNNM